VVPEIQAGDPGDAIRALPIQDGENALAIGHVMLRFLGGRLPSADVGFANIDLASVQALGTAIDVRTLVTAGYFHTRTPQPARYAHRERRIDGGWAADRFVRE